MTYDTDPLLASAGRGILFFLKLSIMHKNGPAVYTKCSHGLFRAARYNYTTQRNPPAKTASTAIQELHIRLRIIVKIF